MLSKENLHFALMSSVLTRRYTSRKISAGCHLSENLIIIYDTLAFSSYKSINRTTSTYSLQKFCLLLAA